MIDRSPALPPALTFQSTRTPLQTRFPCYLSLCSTLFGLLFLFPTCSQRLLLILGYVIDLVFAFVTHLSSVQNNFLTNNNANFDPLGKYAHSCQSINLQRRWLILVSWFDLLTLFFLVFGHVTKLIARKQLAIYRFFNYCFRNLKSNVSPENSPPLVSFIKSIFLLPPSYSQSHATADQYHLFSPWCYPPSLS